MKKGLIILVTILSILTLTGCSRIVEGTEITRQGILTDRAMSTVSNAAFAESRAYITVTYENGEADCYWAAKGDSFPDTLALGDTVEVKSGIEEGSGLLVVIEVTEITD